MRLTVQAHGSKPNCKRRKKFSQDHRVSCTEVTDANRFKVPRKSRNRISLKRSWDKPRTRRSASTLEIAMTRDGVVYFQERGE